MSRRKRQHEVIEALAGKAQVVVAGGWAGAAEERDAWERLVRDTGTVWLGEVTDPAAVAALQERAQAMVHLSSAEVQSLAVMECLGRGTPVIASDIPSHRELASSYPDLVHVVSGPSAVAAALRALPKTAQRQAPRPPVPDWGDVAAALEAVYVSLLAR